MKRVVKRTILAGLIGGASILMAGDTLAVVNGVKITKEDANSFLKLSSPSGAALSYDALSDKDKKALLQRLIENELIKESAEKSGIEKSAEYKKALQRAKNNLLIQEWLKKQYQDTIISDSEAKDFYNKNKNKFIIPGQVHARHILLKSKKEAEAVINELKGLKGEELKKKFIELAKAKSTGPSAVKGGDLGFFSKNQMVLPFANAAFSLEPGQITKEPVKTQFGWHIIYVEAKKPAHTIPFERVKSKIISLLKQKHFSEKLKTEIEHLKSEAKISYEGNITK